MTLKLVLINPRTCKPIFIYFSSCFDPISTFKSVLANGQGYRWQLTHVMPGKAPARGRILRHLGSRASGCGNLSCAVLRKPCPGPGPYISESEFRPFIVSSPPTGNAPARQCCNTQRQTERWENITTFILRTYLGKFEKRNGSLSKFQKNTTITAIWSDWFEPSQFDQIFGFHPLPKNPIAQAGLSHATFSHFFSFF